MKKLFLTAAVAILLSPFAGFAADDHVAVTPDQLKWGPAPPNFPKGAEFAIVSGDATKEGNYVLRIKTPAGYKVPAHTHPNDENVTVLSGNFNVGMGPKLDEGKGTAMKAGSFFKAPKGMQHYAWCSSDGPCMIQLHGTGPQTLVYVDAANDPHKSN